MLHKGVLTVTLACLVVTCGPVDTGSDAPEGGSKGDARGAEASAEWPQALARTADPFARGWGHDDFPRVQEVAPGVYTYEQLRSAGEQWFTTVSMFVVTDDGVLVADGQGSVEETARMIQHIGSVTSQPITHLVIGSDHGDHTAGNAAFPHEMAVYAHPTSAAALAAAASRAPADVQQAPPVTRLVEDREVLLLGGRSIEIHFLGRAHTGGDLVVYLPVEKVLFMSESYLHRVFPAMRSAYPNEWVAMIEAAQAMDVDVYVPGHGFVDPPEILKAELEVFREALVTVIGEVTRLHQAGVPLEDAMERATFGHLESWSLRSSQGPVAVRQVYAELNGELQ